MASIEPAIALTTRERVFLQRRITIASTFPVLVAVLAAIFTISLGTTARAATITVSTLSDPIGPSGTCSLRDAITAANTKTTTNDCPAGSGNDTIIFNVTGTIILSSELPAIVGNLTISGRGRATHGITIDGTSHQIMIVDSGAALTLQFLTLANGRNFGDGGAVSSSGILTVTNSTFSNNAARPFCEIGICIGHSGGAISNSGTAIITNSTFNDNTGTSGFACTGGKGGAIYNLGTLSVTSSAFTGNSTPLTCTTAVGDGGGAIANAGTLSVTNSTFTENSSSRGGAIFNHGATAAFVTNSTFSENSAVFGGAVFGSSSVKGSILTASTGGNCNNPGTAPLPTDAGYNISDDSSCGFAKTDSADNGDNVDPLLSGLANNGGPTQTIALQAKSPAIDAIPKADCTDQSSPPKQNTRDQRGFPRPDAGEAVCDIGAYESAY